MMRRRVGAITTSELDITRVLEAYLMGCLLLTSRLAATTVAYLWRPRIFAERLFPVADEPHRIPNEYMRPATFVTLPLLGFMVIGSVLFPDQIDGSARLPTPAFIREQLLALKGNGLLLVAAPILVWVPGFAGCLVLALRWRSRVLRFSDSLAISAYCVGTFFVLSLVLAPPFGYFLLGSREVLAHPPVWFWIVGALAWTIPLRGFYTFLALLGRCAGLSLRGALLAWLASFALWFLSMGVFLWWSGPLILAIESGGHAGALRVTP